MYEEFVGSKVRYLHRKTQGNRYYIGKLLKISVDCYFVEDRNNYVWRIEKDDMLEMVRIK